ncbi:MAG: tryptophan synthase subunit beta, partial [Marinobacter sp.]|nr:tryptophan synthase subunit beta [Marinobacter sp.]
MSMKLTEEMLSALPDARGHFGAYGGRFVSETLMDSLMTLEKEYLRLKKDPDFQKAFDEDLAHYVGRPSPLYFAKRLTRETG